MQWLTLIVLALSVSQLAAQCYAALIVVLVLAVHLVVRSPWQMVFSNFIAAGLVLAGGLVFAALLVGAHAADQERRRALDELRIRLRDSRELDLTQERERTARALHDNLGHRLTTIGVSLDYARRIFPDDPAKADAELRRARQDTSEAQTAPGPSAPPSPRKATAALMGATSSCSTFPYHDPSHLHRRPPDAAARSSAAV